MAQFAGEFYTMHGVDDGQLSFTFAISTSSSLYAGMIMPSKSSSMPPFPKHTPLIINADVVEDVLYISTYRIDKTARALSAFLQKTKALTKTKAELLFSTLNADEVWNATQEVLENARLEPTQAAGVIRALNSIRKAEEDWKNLLLAGLSLPACVELMRVFPFGNACEKLMANPYQIGRMAGLSLEACDRCAYIADMDANPLIQQFRWNNEDRIQYICQQAADCMDRQGSVYMTMMPFIKLLRTCAKNGLIQMNDALLFAKALANPLYHAAKEDGKLHIYLEKNYRMELECTQMIKSRQNNSISSFSIPDSELTQYDPDQIAAIHGSLGSSCISIITGGPGTGKTTVLKAVAAALEANHQTTALCAPTGRASAKMAESTGRHASTIHKLIGVRHAANADLDAQYNQNAVMPYNAIIVDESSMISLELLWYLLRAASEECRIIFVGDPNQLPSVAPGSVLADLLQSGIIPVYRLTTIHRQQHGSAIVTNAYAILHQNPSLMMDQDFTIWHYDNRDAAIPDILNAFAQNYDQNDPYKFQILTATRKGVLGKDHLNEMIIGMMPGRRSKYGFAVHDKVMTIRNRYQQSGSYMNGDLGLIERITSDGFSVKTFDGSSVLVDTKADLDLAYAATIHKAQGSEYEHIMIVLDEEYPNMLYTNLLYTAVTRAKKKVTLIIIGDALQRAEQTPMPKRLSYLSRRLQG